MSLSETPISSSRGEKQPANIYTVMLVISLLAISIACACLWWEMTQYNWDMRAAGAQPPTPPALGQDNVAPPQEQPPTPDQPQLPPDNPEQPPKQDEPPQ